MGSEVGRLDGVAGLWLEGRWRSTDGPLYRTTASPWMTAAIRTHNLSHKPHFSVLSPPATHRELSRQHHRKVSEGPGAGRRHHRYGGTVHLLWLEGTGACWGMKAKAVSLMYHWKQTATDWWMRNWYHDSTVGSLYNELHRLRCHYKHLLDSRGGWGDPGILGMSL